MWSNYTEMPTELTLPFDEWQCPAPPAEPMLGIQDDGSMVCLLTARTAKERWSASWWGENA